MPGRTVLVLTQQFDFGADYLVKRLYERAVDVVRFDSGCFPRDAALVARLESDPAACLTRITPTIGRPVSLPDIASIWYGCPTDFSVHPDLDSDALDFAQNEALQAVGGLLRSADCPWVNHPEKCVSAGYKPYQLTVATRLGLSIPRTLITNDPAQAREFIGTNKNGTIYKTLNTPRIESEVYETSMIFTSKVSDADLEAVESIRYTPCLLQEFVPKAFEVRITVIDGQAFCVALYAPEPGVTDWRPVTDELRYAVHQLPQRVSDLCVRLVRELGLVFGAIDMIVTPDDEYVFLEINPSGQFLWLEFATGLPMSDTLLDYLAPFSAARTGKSA